MDLTVKEYADRERVAERTVWRWIAEGKVPNLRRTPGGSVRIPEPTRGGSPLGTAMRNVSRMIILGTDPA